MRGARFVLATILAMAPAARAQAPEARVGVGTLTVTRIHHQQMAELDLASGRLVECAARVQVEMALTGPGLPVIFDGLVGDLTARAGEASPPVRLEEIVGHPAGVRLVIELSEVPVGPRTIAELAGRMRLFGQGEVARLRLPLRVGAVGRHRSGLNVTVRQIHRVGATTTVVASAEYPDVLTLRTDERGNAFSAAVIQDEAQRATALRSDDDEEPSRAGKRRRTITVRLGHPEAPPEELVLTAEVRRGPARVLPFVLHDLPLPLAMSEIELTGRERRAIAAPLRVEVNGRPAGEGTLAVGVAVWRNGGWGPIRWTELRTGHSPTRFTLPGEGRYRIQRRWTPADPRLAAALAGAPWRNDDLEIEARAPSVTLPPLAVEGIALPTGQRPQPVLTCSIGSAEVVATRVREIRYAGATFSPRRGWRYVRGGRLAQVTLSLRADSADDRAALAWLWPPVALASDGNRLESPEAMQWLRPVSPFASEEDAAVTLHLSDVPAWCRSIEAIAGSVVVAERGWAADLTLPLEAPGPLRIETGDLLLVGEWTAPQGVVLLRLRVERPAGASARFENLITVRPELLDVQKRRLAIGYPPDEAPNMPDPAALRVAFRTPRGGRPAFVRLPIVVTLGNSRAVGYRLTGIPLPLPDSP